MVQLRLIFAIFVLVTKFQFLQTKRTQLGFSYDFNSINGPRFWGTLFSDCNKERQSPINIEVNKLDRAFFKHQLKLVGLNAKLASVEVSNDLLSVFYRFKWKDQVPALYGGLLGCTYLLDSLHFHWGILNNDGSEHAINGTKYVLEGHFVFFNEIYKTPANALQHSDGFAVIGVLFEYDRFAPDIELLNVMKNMTKYGDKITIPNPNINFKELMPSNFIYAYYKGSFTQPPCFQIVDWIVSLEILTVNPKQMRQLRELQDMFARPISNNFRSLQMVNNRHVLLGLISNDLH